MYSRSRNNIAFTVTQTSDGGYAVSGGVGEGCWLVKTDSFGDTLWTRMYVNGGWNNMVCAHRVIQLADGGYLIAGTRSYYPGDSIKFCVIRTDSTGDSLWLRTYFWPQSEVGDMARVGDGFLVAGQVLRGDTAWAVSLVRIDSLGEEVWSRIIDHTGGGIVEGLTLCNGGYAVCGVTGVDQALIARFDTAGRLLWYRGYPGVAFVGILATSDNGFVASGTGFGSGGDAMAMIKVDSLGNPLWYRKYCEPAQTMGHGMCRATDSGYVMVGDAVTGPAYMVKVGEQGDLKWVRRYGRSAFWTTLMAVQATEDGGYIACGEYMGVGQFYLVKTDDEGSSAIAEGYESACPIREAECRVKVNNPVLPGGELRFLVTVPGHIRLDLYDATGRRVAELRQSECDSGWHTARLPVNLSPGTYFLRLCDEGTSSTERVVVLR